MVVIGIIAILSAIGIPAYQNYLRKAALTDLLQTFCPLPDGHRTLRARSWRPDAMRRRQQRHSLADNHTLPLAMSVAKGVVTLTGQESLNGLGVTLTPTWDNAEGVTGWQRVCTITGNSALSRPAKTSSG
ncbi:prepilin peptidase-dependent pilin [Klebsiella variicola subsp. variicola]|nr:prepilin peptidase-dependent pilin [Klebsiella variicola subsp. variicola]